MQNFSEVLSRVFANLLHSNRPPVFIRINGGRRKVLAEEIVLIESFNHRREILLSDGQKLETAMTLKELEELLKEYGEFCSPHRTYIVNLDHVRGVQGNNLLLKDRVLPIAKNSYRQLKEYYLKYSFDK